MKSVSSITYSIHFYLMEEKSAIHKTFSNFEFFFLEKSSKPIFTTRSHLFYRYQMAHVSCRLLLTFFFVFLRISLTEETDSVLFSISENTQYQCTSPGCTPSQINFTNTLLKCGYACLMNSQCHLANYNHLNHLCEIFADIPSQYGTLLSQLNIATIIAIDDRQASARKLHDKISHFSKHQCEI